jgi:TetR/AcrR family transcriptional repressor of mexJK operon
MPRLAGQVDRAKAEAMLVAAGEVISERGFGAPVEAIARRAGVSKQTLYNHYGGKAGLIRALIGRWVDEVTAPLGDDQPEPEIALKALANVIMTAQLAPTTISLTRAVIQGASDMPEVAHAMYEAGSVATRRRIAEFLKTETAAGRLAVDDAEEAAEFFTAMVAARQMRALLGLDPGNEPDKIAKLSAHIAHRFVVAYAPKRQS